MPSFDHEALVEVIRDAPEVLRDLLQLGGEAAPQATTIHGDTANLTELQPAEFRADLVALFKRDDVPVLGVVVEVQLWEKPRKLLTWPAYQAVARARHDCPVIILVYTPSAAVASWAAAPVDLGGGSVFRAVVLGPSKFPKLTEVEQARRSPHLAVLAVVAHAEAGEPEEVARMAAAAAEATVELPEPAAAIYWDLIESALGDAARAALEHLMDLDTYQFKGPTALKNQAIGRAEGMAGSVLTVLDARSLSVTEDQKRRILAETDLAQLSNWVAKAATVTTVDELFEH